MNMKTIIQTVLLLSLLFTCVNLQAQNVTKGTVTDATGEPVIGATVMEKGNAKNSFAHGTSRAIQISGTLATSKMKLEGII